RGARRGRPREGLVRARTRARPELRAARGLAVAAARAALSRGARRLIEDQGMQPRKIANTGRSGSSKIAANKATKIMRIPSGREKLLTQPLPGGERVRRPNPSPANDPIPHAESK